MNRADILLSEINKQAAIMEKRFPGLTLPRDMRLFAVLVNLSDGFGVGLKKIRALPPHIAFPR